MFTALYTAKSGMTAQQTNMDLHSHNLCQRLHHRLQAQQCRR